MGCSLYSIAQPCSYLCPPCLVHCGAMVGIACFGEFITLLHVSSAGHGCLQSQCHYIATVIIHSHSCNKRKIPHIASWCRIRGARAKQSRPSRNICKLTVAVQVCLNRYVCGRQQILLLELLLLLCELSYWCTSGVSAHTSILYSLHFALRMLTVLEIGYKNVSFL